MTSKLWSADEGKRVMSYQYVVVGRQLFQKEFMGIKSVKEGIFTQIWCVTSPFSINIGCVYCENTDITILGTDFDPDSKWRDDVEKLSGVMPFALDAETAEKLWNLREELY